MKTEPYSEGESQNKWKIFQQRFKFHYSRPQSEEELQWKKHNHKRQIFLKSNVAKDYQDFIDEVIKKEKELDSKMNESEAK